MTIKIISAFPALFREWMETSIVYRSQKKGLVKIELVDLHQYVDNNFHQLDDEAYGGGGMVMRAEPIVQAIRFHAAALTNCRVCLLTPQGKMWTQTQASAFAAQAAESDFIFIAGRYEGIDARVEKFVDEFISIGDYVVTGGELPAMVVIESIVRLLPGVINQSSLASESFDDGLLDYSVYTRPQIFEGMAVPEVYLSGNHQLIAKSRLASRIENTKKHRPDLYAEYLLKMQKANK